MDIPDLAELVSPHSRNHTRHMRRETRSRTRFLMSLHAEEGLAEFASVEPNQVSTFSSHDEVVF